MGPEEQNGDHYLFLGPPYNAAERATKLFPVPRNRKTRATPKIGPGSTPNVSFSSTEWHIQSGGVLKFAFAAS
jgi:hypothetical protein